MPAAVAAVVLIFTVTAVVRLKPGTLIVGVPVIWP